MLAKYLAMAMVMSLAPAHAAEVKLLASGAVKQALVELIPAFEKSSGHKVAVLWAGTEAAMKRIEGGEVVDIIILSVPGVEKLTAAGKLAAGSRVDIAKSGVGVAVRAGLPKPNISSGETVKQAVLQAKSVAYSSGPSGHYLIGLFNRMAIAEQIKDKVKQTPSGVMVADIMARGEADLGFQQVSELLHAKGIDFVGPLPADIQQVTVFASALHAAAPSPDAAKVLVKFLTSPDAAQAIRRSGMEPG
jgi:molybdate transport system substrate-binding protein